MTVALSSMKVSGLVTLVYPSVWSGHPSLQMFQNSADCSEMEMLNRAGHGGKVRLIGLVVVAQRTGN